MSFADNGAMKIEKIRFALIDTPVGPLLVAGSQQGLMRVSYTFDGKSPEPEAGWVEDDGVLDPVRKQVGEWFTGTRTQFDLALCYSGNVFQRSVWQAILEIPFGETATYGEIARRIGEGPAASRAVGSACGDNPLPLVIPCHRVVGAGGTLTGFSHGVNGGLAVKRKLLDHEFAIRPPAGTLFSLA
ncbi:MAG: methylated-DNA--[protein]-cysteine S-methyltransferase [Rhizobiaceae bacterium]